jgi:hypothetical protein
MIGSGNRSTRRKHAPVPVYPPQTPHALSGREPGVAAVEVSDYPLQLRHGHFLSIV